MNTTLMIRLIVGWTYFSAFWRRLILENKLDPEAAGYIGEKFNHFLPHALIQAPIEFFLLHPDLLWWKMLLFTIVEGIVGLLFMLGFMTRIMALSTTLLALGILLSAGWIGTTCLDEWQIGLLGMAGGLTVFFAGTDEYSLDRYLGIDKANRIFDRFVNNRSVVLTSILMFVLALGTNQIFHGGVWGTLHNKSVSPELAITEFKRDENLHFDLMRVEGADVYGSFLYKLEVKDLTNGKTLLEIQGEQWQKISLDIRNHYIAKIRPHKYSLLIPLGAKATITIPGLDTKNPVELTLTDINGKTWSKTENGE